MRILKNFLCFLVMCIPLMGCEVLVGNVVEKAFDSANKNRELPILSEGQETEYSFREGLLTTPIIFKITVKESYWKDYYEMPGIPEAARTPETRIKPQDTEDKFLVVKVSITNTENKTLMFPRSSPPSFTLIDEKGNEYHISSNPIFGAENIMSKILQGVNINPNRSLTGELVFDVSKGNYMLIVSRGSLVGPGMVKPGWNFSKYKLSPVDKDTSTINKKIGK